MRTRIEARGTASAATMWAAYADSSRWADWAPQIRRVEPLGPLEVGLRGRVDGPFFSRARFEVTHVDETTRRWSWKVAIGPAHLAIDHEVREGATAVVIEGPAPLVLAYAPVARLALTRLANLARAG
ncbi:MAG TPA: SRPBCC family protein [Actinomycetota bacterium]|jgi:hypothetical protein